MQEVIKDVVEAVTPRMDMAAFVSTNIMKLVAAAALGGVIGLERELKHKPAGLRTNMFICFGAAMYTILSQSMSPQADQTRIAAQIIPGIGFIGAGSILHAKGSVTGLTTAATLFVVASIGMAVGAGHFLTALFATMVIFLALTALGWVESRFNLKPQRLLFDATGRDAEEMMAVINNLLESERRILESVQMGGSEGKHRVQFTLTGKRQDLQRIQERLRSSQAFERVEASPAAEYE